MFIAHAPSSLIIRHYLPQKWKTKSHFWAGVAGSIFPDCDLIWFYFVDHGSTHHHDYFTHIPIFWLACLLFWLIFIPKNKTYRGIGIVFLINIFMHLALDTLAGDIAWFYPYLTEKISLVSVPNLYGWWVLNFTLHWTFLLELTILTWGLTLFCSEN